MVINSLQAFYFSAVFPTILTAVHKKKYVNRKKKKKEVSNCKYMFFNQWSILFAAFVIVKKTTKLIKYI